MEFQKNFEQQRKRFFNHKLLLKMNKKEKTLPLEPRDIERLKERYGQNFIDAYGKGVLETSPNKIISFVFIFGIFLVVIVIIAVFSNLNISGNYIISLFFGIFVLSAFLGFFYIQSAERIKSYNLMQTVIAQNVKRRITGRASLEDIIDDDGTYYGSYWEVKTDDGTYNFEALKCKDGDVVQVDFVVVGKEIVVLSSKPIDPTANA